MSKRSLPLHPRWRKRVRTAATGIVCAVVVALAPALAASIAGTALAAQEPAPTGPFTLRGTVHDAANMPIPSAVVTVFGLTGSATTNEKGEFSLTRLPGGTRVVQVIALGYKPRALAVAIAGDTPSATITLQRANVILDSMQIVGKRMADDASRRPSDRITAKELSSPDIVGVNALEAFALLRPHLFVGRSTGNGSATTPAAERGRFFIRDNVSPDPTNPRPVCVGNRACDIDGRLSVSINEGPIGSPDILTAIPARIVKEMRYLQPADATARFGMLTGGGPVLVIYTK